MHRKTCLILTIITIGYIGYLYFKNEGSRGTGLFGNVFKIAQPVSGRVFVLASLNISFT